MEFNILYLYFLLYLYIYVYPRKLIFYLYFCEIISILYFYNIKNSGFGFLFLGVIILYFCNMTFEILVLLGKKIIKMIL